MTDPVVSVQQQLFPPGPPPPDSITMYEGATQFKPWKAWDVRSWLNRLVWDLLRFQKIDDHAPPADRSVPQGLRDTVSTIWFLVDQNNQLLKALATAHKVPLTGVRHLHKTKPVEEVESPFDEAIAASVAEQHNAMTQVTPPAAPAQASPSSPAAPFTVAPAEYQILQALRAGQLRLVPVQAGERGEL